MKKYSYQAAKTIIQSVCKAAEQDEFPTRETFFSFLDQNPDLAVQGYNAYGKVFFWNTASVILYGYRQEEAINQDLFELIIPPEMRALARASIRNSSKNGKIIEASACDLVHENGDFVTVYSGHLLFYWENASTPEFYCIDLALESDEDAISPQPEQAKAL